MQIYDIKKIPDHLKKYFEPAPQIGLEKTPEEYVEKMVLVFREIWRVLRDDGTVFLNLGDSYAQSGGSGSGEYQKRHKQFGKVAEAGTAQNPKSAPPGLKPKDMCGIPWWLAFALQADGWTLRSDIIWYKPNPMPESCTDRPTKSHEYIFLLTKKPKYYYDAEAIREPHLTADTDKRFENGPSTGKGKTEQGNYSMQCCGAYNPNGRNKRSVWTVTTHGYPDAHFATFPPKLIEPCILAGTSEKGVCPECGKPWERIVEKSTRFEGGSGKAGKTSEQVNSKGKWAGIQYGENIKLGPVVDTKTIGWEPSCSHIGDPVPGITLDPFAGSGTVAAVSKLHKRRSIAIELKLEYCDLTVKRIITAIPGDTIEQANHMRIPEGGLL